MEVRNVTVPGSKSVAARALVLNEVYRLGLEFENLPECDDTRELGAALRQLSRHAPERYDLGTGGTSLRFFTALVASLPGVDAVIDCSDALRRRPLRPLVDALRAAGADIEYLRNEGEAPLHVRGKKLNGSGVKVEASISSQFASALAMVSDLWSSPFELPVEVVSRPYLEMTVRMREQFRGMTGGNYHVEGDWSAASYFYEWAMLNPGVPVMISGLCGESLQGDSACAEIFSRLGVQTEYLAGGVRIVGGDEKERGMLRFDMEATPDLVPALAVGMSVAGIDFEMTGIDNLRYKECDRIAALTEETERFERFGLQSDFDSHGDHRIAMALAAAGVPAGKIKGKDCVSKSFPGFFSELKKLM